MLEFDVSAKSDRKLPNGSVQNFVMEKLYLCKCASAQRGCHTNSSRAQLTIYCQLHAVCIAVHCDSTSPLRHPYTCHMLIYSI